MATEKVKIKTCNFKKSGDKNGRRWTIYTIELEDGREGESFDRFQPGEEAEVNVESSQYGLKFSKVKQSRSGGGYQQTRGEFNKQVALKCATKLIVLVGKDVTSEGVLKLADKLNNWLENGQG